jgi:transcriptional regulator with XRE-family HTH domain
VVSSKSLLAGLGDAIRALRVERGDISQEQLGLDSGVHRNYIGGIERGERSPTVIKIATLAATLEVPLSELMARAEAHAQRHEIAARRNG